MKKNGLLLILALFCLNTTFATEAFNFTDTCIDVFSKLDEATLKFHAVLENETDTKTLLTALDEYNNDLVLFSLNKLTKYTKSENPVIEAVANDLTNVISDLVKSNYGYQHFLTNSKFNQRKLKKRSIELIEQNVRIAKHFEGIALGVRVLLLKPSPENEDDKMYIELTLNQRNALNEKLTTELGNIIPQDTNTECDCKTSFEHALRLIHVFINLDWVFEKE